MFVFAVSVLIALPKGIALLAKQNCNQSTTEAAGSFLPDVNNRMKLFNLQATTDCSYSVAGTFCDEASPD